MPWLAKSGNLRSLAPDDVRQIWARREFRKFDAEVLGHWQHRDIPVVLRFPCGHEARATNGQLYARKTLGKAICPVCYDASAKTKGLGANGKPTQNTSPEIRSAWGKEQFANLGIEMLGQYERAEKKVLVKFKCGHLDSITLTSANQAAQAGKTACKLCSGSVAPVAYEKEVVVDRETLRTVRVNKNTVEVDILNEDDPLFRLLPFYFGDWATCTYCGCEAQCVEHVIPVCFFLRTPRSESSQSFVNSQGIRTSACNSCNNFAGGKVFNTFEEKCVFINWRIQIRLKRLRTAGWTSDEVQELKGKLKDYVKLKKSEKENLENRANWFGSNSFFEVIDGLDSQPVFFKDSGVYAQSVYDYFESTMLKLIAYRDRSKR
jgi:hypothetical protein